MAVAAPPTPPITAPWYDPPPPPPPFVPPAPPVFPPCALWAGSVRAFNALAISYNTFSKIELPSPPAPPTVVAATMPALSSDPPPPPAFGFPFPPVFPAVTPAPELPLTRPPSATPPPPPPPLPPYPAHPPGSPEYDPAPPLAAAVACPAPADTSIAPDPLIVPVLTITISPPPPPPSLAALVPAAVIAAPMLTFPPAIICKIPPHSPAVAPPGRIGTGIARLPIAARIAPREIPGLPCVVGKLPRTCPFCRPTVIV